MPRESQFTLAGYPDLTGCLADVAGWFMQTAIRPRREAAYVVALSFGSVVCGRFYAFERSFSSNYVCVIAETGSGKQDIYRAVNILVEKMRCPGLLLNANSFTSDAGCHAAIATQPQAICLMDEFGSIMQAMNASAISQTALTTLTRAFTSADSTLTPKSYSDKDPESPKHQIIVRPALTLLGFGNPDDIAGNLTHEAFTSGQLSRYLFFKMGNEPVYMNSVMRDPPEKVITELRRIILNAQQLEDECVFQPYNTHIPPTVCTLERGDINTIDLDYHQQEEVFSAKDEIKKALLTRQLEKGKRLAIVLSLLGTYGADLESPIITQKSLVDALSIVRKSDELILSILDGMRTYGTRIHNAAEEVKAYLDTQFESGFEKVSSADAARACTTYYKKCNSQARQQVFALLDDEGIATIQDGKGKNAPFYFTENRAAGCIERDARIAGGIF